MQNSFAKNRQSLAYQIVLLDAELAGSLNFLFHNLLAIVVYLCLSRAAHCIFDQTHNPLYLIHQVVWYRASSWPEKVSSGLSIQVRSLLHTDWISFSSMDTIHALRY